jgi:uncharacterized protein (TIGR03435 family)
VLKPIVFRAGIRGERYEVRNATMVDLIGTAYDVNGEQVVGGPSWLEFDRFDITALVRPNTPPETVRLMLQSLLADRFKLTTHRDSRPITGLVLSLGKGKLKMKEAEAADKTGCQRQVIAPPSRASGVPMFGISCRNTTMEAFAKELPDIAGNGYIPNRVVDSTGLKKAWDFDFKFTQKELLQFSGDAVALADALDQQLGLKLEEQKLPTPVIVVDRASEKPSANSPDVAKRLPPMPSAEFEVAVIKPINPDPREAPAVGFGLQPGGRLTIPGRIIPLKQLIAIAWNVGDYEDILGVPKWIDSARYDIIAKLPATGLTVNGEPSQPDVASMIQALLIDRFKMKIHYEERMVTAYTLMAAKPKLKKADPSARTGCKVGNGPVISNTGAFIPPSRSVTCVNITLAQFAEQLQDIAGSSVRYPVVDSTGLEGGWDLSFRFNPLSSPQSPFGAPAGTEPSDPIGGASLFNAIEKQLGLKLQEQKRSYPVFVIDHIEEKPTDN